MVDIKDQDLVVDLKDQDLVVDLKGLDLVVGHKDKGDLEDLKDLD